MEKKSNIIKELSFQFALKIMGYSSILGNKHFYTISKQVLRSGTSIGANIREALHFESRADFIHKLKIYSKEAEETLYWLLLCKSTPDYPDPEFLFDDLDIFKKSSVKSSLHQRKAST